MFEAWLGPGRFRSAVRAFLARHAWGTATSADFFRAVGESADDSDAVVRAMRGFVTQPGAPLIDVALRCEGAPAIEVSQRRFRPKGSTAPELQWTTPACFSYRADGKDATQCTTVTSSSRIPIESPSCPSWLLGNAGGRGHYLVRYERPLLRRIAARAADLPSKEAQAFARDTLLLADAGLVPVADAFVVAEAVLGHASPTVRLAGVDLLEGLRDEWLSDAERREKGRVVRERVMPIARSLGWLPRSADSNDTRALRAAVMGFAPDRDEGASLRREARTLALRWIADTGSVDSTMGQVALDVAGRFADAKTFARIERAALATGITRERLALIGALVRARDPRLRARALELALATSDGKPRLDPRASYSLLAAALRDDESRDAAFDYVLANLEALETKLPRDTPASLLVPMGDVCSRPRRDALAAAFRDRAARYMTGSLRYAQALESIDLCLAAHR
jgi:alanyl aminopeptidase